MGASVVIRCPLCVAWVMEGSYEGTVTVNCKGQFRDDRNRKCGAILEVRVANGLPNVSVVGSTLTATKKA